MKSRDLSIEYKKIFPTFKIGWKYEEIFTLLEFLGNPHKKIEKKVIHITGTNGKGSVCSYIKTILETAGYKVGIFTSPHLITYNERYYFNKRYATNEEIEKCKNEVLEKCKMEIKYFDFNTLIAIMLFSNYFNDKNFEELDFCIFEASMGGRFDSTNVFQNLIACCITSISFDHMEYLGDTLAKIAYEKGGIIKPNVPCFTVNTKPETINVLQKIADEIGIKLYKLGQDFNLDLTLKPSLLGDHQFENATLAKEICKYIGIDEKYIREGISNTEWKGRLQKIKLKNIDNEELKIKEIYLDGAHNEDGIRVLCNYISQQKGENVNIIGIMTCLKKKDYKSFFKSFNNIFDLLLFYNVPKGVNNFIESKELEMLADEYKIKNGEINNFEELKNIISKNKENIIFIFGSLYFLGYILENYIEN